MSTAEQKQVIKYFTKTGCLAALFGMSDDAYDQMLMNKLNSLDLKKRALDKIGLDEDQLKEIPPVYLHGYSFDKATSSGGIVGKVVAAASSLTGSYMKIGKDGRLRSSKYDATWLFFSNTQVYMYCYTFDMASDSKKETTEEYFYKDITNFTTSAETVSAPQSSGCMGASKSESREYNRFTLTVPGDKFYCSVSGVADAENIISAMKQKLREKKG